HGNRTFGAKNPARLSKKPRVIEPMQTLRDCDEIDARIRQSTRLRRSNAVFDPRMQTRVGDLLGARVGCNYPVKMIGQAAGSLTISCCAIERYPAHARECCNKIK